MPAVHCYRATRGGNDDRQTTHTPRRRAIADADAAENALRGHSRRRCFRPALLHALDRAAEVAAELEARRLSVHFATGEDSRVRAQVVDADGNVLRELPVGEALRAAERPGQRSRRPSWDARHDARASPARASAAWRRDRHVLADQRADGRRAAPAGADPAEAGGRAGRVSRRSATRSRSSTRSRPRTSRSPIPPPGPTPRRSPRTTTRTSRPCAPAAPPRAPTRSRSRSSRARISSRPPAPPRPPPTTCSTSRSAARRRTSRSPPATRSTSIAAKIQGVGSSPVYASVVGGQLVISDRATGTAARISSITTDGTSGLAFAESRTAQDAAFTVDGTAHSSGSNVVTDVVAGVTLTLQAARRLDARDRHRRLAERRHRGAADEDDGVRHAVQHDDRLHPGQAQRGPGRQSAERRRPHQGRAQRRQRARGPAREPPQRVQRPRHRPPRGAAVAGAGRHLDRRGDGRGRTQQRFDRRQADLRHGRLLARDRRATSTTSRRSSRTRPAATRARAWPSGSAAR